MSTRKPRTPKQPLFRPPRSRRIRSFALGTRGDPTHVEMHERSDGSYELWIVTARLDMNPMMTGLRITPELFSLMSEAMFRAAHDPTIWQPPQTDVEQNNAAAEMEKEKP